MNRLHALLTYRGLQEKQASAFLRRSAHKIILLILLLLHTPILLLLEMKYQNLMYYDILLVLRASGCFGFTHHEKGVDPPHPYPQPHFRLSLSKARSRAF